ncbi:hypothetical protein [Paraburkholderia fungorum]|nr:hypothetical protein [Paraburkholderia fungorum]
MNNRIHVMREAVVKITQLLAGKKIKVTQRGVKAFVESDTRTGQIKRINLPFIPDDASDEFLEALQGYLDHEVGHVLFSDFKEIGRGVELGVAVSAIRDAIRSFFIVGLLVSAIFEGVVKNPYRPLDAVLRCDIFLRRIWTRNGCADKQKGREHLSAFESDAHLSGVTHWIQ